MLQDRQTNARRHQQQQQQGRSQRTPSARARTVVIEGDAVRAATVAAQWHSAVGVGRCLDCAAIGD